MHVRRSSASRDVLLFLKYWGLPASVSTLAVFVVLAFSRVYVPLPQFFAVDRVNVSASTLALAGLVVAFVVTLDEPVGHVWRTSSRPVRWIAVIRFVCLVGIAVLVGAFALPPLQAGLNSAILVVLSVEVAAARRLFGTQLAWIIPLTHVAFSSVFGVVGEVLQPWAWPIAEELTGELAVTMMLNMLVGVVILVAPRRLLRARAQRAATGGAKRERYP